MIKNVDRRLLTILLIVFVQIAGGALILPILPLYAQRQFRMAPEVITLLVSSFFAAQFLAGPTLGRLSDKYGRLPVLIVSQVGTVVSFIMMALAQDVPMLFAARILDGITGGNIIVAQAYITDITPCEKRAQSLGYVFAAFGLGFIFGPALGGVLSAAFGARLPFFVAAAATAVAVLLTWLTLDETLSPEQREANRRFRQASLSPRQVMLNRALVLVLVVAFAGQFAFGLLQSTFALYGEAVLFQGYSEESADVGIGLLLAAVGVAQFFTQVVLLPQALRRTGEATLVIVGTLLRSLGFLIFAVITSPWLGVFGSLAFAGGMGLMMPPLQALATHTVADELRGGVLGLYQSAVGLSIILSTAVAGSIFAVDPVAPYWLGLVLSFVALLPTGLLWRWAAQGRLQPERVVV